MTCAPSTVSPTPSSTPASAEIAYIPLNHVPVANPSVLEKIATLHDALDEFDDVQAVFSNEENAAE